MKKKKRPIIDFHCDLPSYLGFGQERTANDLQVRCSLPQLQAGGVKLQIMALFAEEEKDAALAVRRQLAAFRKGIIGDGGALPLKAIEGFEASDRLHACLGIEGGRCLLDDGEAMESCFSKLELMEQEYAKVAYVSLTWNHENRFGGGAATNIGLKEEGKTLLHWMDGKKIAVDLSHASDALAEGIFNEIDKCGLDIPLLASHSNMRTVHDVPRNLPHTLLKELLARGGVVGLNLINKFIGEGSMADHLHYLLQAGGEQNCVLGADFFCSEDWAAASGLDPEDVFPEDFSNASRYPELLMFLKNTLALDEQTLDNLAYENAMRWIKRSLYGSHSAA